MGGRGMKLRITWIIIGLLTTILLSNLIAICNIIKLFLFNHGKGRAGPTTQSRSPDQIYGYKSVTKVYGEQHPEITTDYSKPLIDSSNMATTLKHRRRYKFDMKKGKYIRIRRPEQMITDADASTKSTELSLSFEHVDSEQETPEYGPFTSHSRQLKPEPSHRNPEVAETQSSTRHWESDDSYYTESQSDVTNNEIDTIEIARADYDDSELESDKFEFNEEKADGEQPESTLDVTTVTDASSSHGSTEQAQTTGTERHSDEVTRDPGSHLIEKMTTKTGMLTDEVSTYSDSQMSSDLKNETNRLSTDRIDSNEMNNVFTIDNKMDFSTLNLPVAETDETVKSTNSMNLKIVTSPKFQILNTRVTVGPVSAKPKVDSTLDLRTITQFERKQVTSATPPIQYSGFTLVTALLDIGRGDWWEYRRPLESYYSYLDNVLSLKVNLVIFVDHKSVAYVHSRRKMLYLDHITKIVPITLAELPFYRYMPAITDIIRSEQTGERWDPKWDRVMSTHPEAKSAEYDILVNSKPYFLYNSSVTNPFSSEYFVWLDAGYAHGNRSVFPINFEWYPMFVSRKISLIKITPEYDTIFRYKMDDLYRKNWAVVSGGFVAGDLYAINRFYRFYFRIFVDMIHQRLIDDDQTTLVLLMQQQPSLFNSVFGDWFDAFRLFGGRF